jgi:hypothetical protein
MNANELIRRQIRHPDRIETGTHEEAGLRNCRLDTGFASGSPAPTVVLTDTSANNRKADIARWNAMTLRFLTVTGPSLRRSFHGAKSIRPGFRRADEAVPLLRYVSPNASNA